VVVDVHHADEADHGALGPFTAADADWMSALLWAFAAGLRWRRTDDVRRGRRGRAA
jgi:hypothetical protein